MFTLLLLLIGIAGVVLPVLAAAHAQRPLPLDQALPVGVLGLTWRRLGERQTRGGPKTLWIGDGDASAYSRAYGADRDGLRALGFSWGGERVGEYGSPVCWEPVPAPADVAYESAIDAADALARAQEEKAAVAEAERLARVRAREEAEFEREAEGRLAAVAELRSRMKTVPWAWSKSQRETATRIFATGDRPTAWAGKEAARMVATVDEMIRRVTAKAQTERREKWWRLAGDLEVQAEVHRATKLLSSWDEDHATALNAMGWSKAHTHLGHVLAGLPRLGQTEASQALWAVHAHRRQIPAELRLRLFGEA